MNSSIKNILLVTAWMAGAQAAAVQIPAGTISSSRVTQKDLFGEDGQGKGEVKLLQSGPPSSNLVDVPERNVKFDFIYIPKSQLKYIRKDLGVKCKADKRYPPELEKLIENSASLAKENGKRIPTNPEDAKELIEEVRKNEEVKANRERLHARMTEMNRSLTTVRASKQTVMNEIAALQARMNQLMEELQKEGYSKKKTDEMGKVDDEIKVKWQLINVIENREKMVMGMKNDAKLEFNSLKLGA